MQVIWLNAPAYPGQRLDKHFRGPRHRGIGLMPLGGEGNIDTHRDAVRSRSSLLRALAMRDRAIH